jgi:hypothetical protein
LHRFAQALVKFWRHVKSRQELRVALGAFRHEDPAQKYIFRGQPGRIQDKTRAVLAPRLGSAINQVALFVSLTAVMEPPMFGVMEPQTGS